MSCDNCVLRNLIVNFLGNCSTKNFCSEEVKKSVCVQAWTQQMLNSDFADAAADNDAGYSSLIYLQKKLPETISQSCFGFLQNIY